MPHPHIKEIELDDNAMASLMEAMEVMPEGEWQPTSIVGINSLTRTLVLSSEIDNEVSAALCSQMRELVREDKKSPITLWISSPGGDIYATFAVIDMIQRIPCPVIGVVQGMAASGAFLILQACDYRITYANSCLFYHEPVYMEVVIDNRTSSSQTHDQYLKNTTTFADLVRKRTKLSEEDFNKIFHDKTSLFFSPQEALAINLIDDILPPRKKEPLTKKEYKALTTKQPMPKKARFSGVFEQKTEPKMEPGIEPQVTSDSQSEEKTTSLRSVIKAKLKSLISKIYV